MRFAYADPPYLGCGGYYDHPESKSWDDPETHRRLVGRLCDEFPDGWAMSLSAPSLRVVLPMCPADCRVGAWVKPFASFKPNVNPGYCWEPVVWRGGRKKTREDRTVPDFCAVNITMRRGFVGAKPEAFCHWVFALLGAGPGDDFHDLFPGSGAVSRAWADWCARERFAERVLTLFGGEGG